MLSAALLTDYADRFYGFGAWNAKVWFIGIEEAGGKREEDVERRLVTWKENGRRELEDAPKFYPACNNRSWHGENAKPQHTWRQLIRMLLLARGEPSGASDVLNYQRHKLGVLDGETCLAELLPLPSPNTAEWNYNNWSELPWLRSRESYIARIRAGRENQLRRQINAHHPSVVIFYGLGLPGGVSLLPSWSSIAGGRFSQAIEGDEILLWRQTGETIFFVTRHPAAESGDYFKEIGEFFWANHRARF